LSIEIYGPSEATPSAHPRAVARQEPSAPPEPAEPEPAARPELPPPDADFNRREADLVRRERALSGSEGLLDAGVADIERRERKVAQMESTFKERMRELDEREERVERREIELEGAFTLREDRVEARETELAELADRLRRKEEDLARYVGQLQAQLTQHP
jgi:hypothetical protein